VRCKRPARAARSGIHTASFVPPVGRVTGHDLDNVPAHRPVSQKSYNLMKSLWKLSTPRFTGRTVQCGDNPPPGGPDVERES